MNLELRVNGCFNLNVKDLNGEEVSRSTEKEVLVGLKNGSLCIDMGKQSIQNPKDLQTDVYLFSIDATDATDYEFADLEDESYY